MPYSRPVRSVSETLVVCPDSSAIVKLVVTEPETAALRRYVASEPLLVSSEIVSVEVRRATRLRSRDPAVARRTNDMLEHIGMVSVTELILQVAAALEPPHLRSPDALHVATALSQPGLRSLVTYDRRMAAAAVTAGLRVDAPH